MIFYKFERGFGRAPFPSPILLLLLLFRIQRGGGRKSTLFEESTQFRQEGPPLRRLLEGREHRGPSRIKLHRISYEVHVHARSFVAGKRG